MSKPIPTVQKYMTTTPHSIGVEQTLSKAHSMMREHAIRHLPVLHGGRLLGILTERDLRLVESLAGVDPATVTVEDAMSTVVYSVSPEAPLDEVVATMAERRLGSTLVVDGARLVGIFTTTDALVALRDVLRGSAGPAGRSAP